MKTNGIQWNSMEFPMGSKVVVYLGGKSRKYLGGVINPTFALHVGLAKAAGSLQSMGLPFRRLQSIVLFLASLLTLPHSGRQCCAKSAPC